MQDNGCFVFLVIILFISLVLLTWVRSTRCPNCNVFLQRRKILEVDNTSLLDWLMGSRDKTVLYECKKCAHKWEVEEHDSGSWHW